MSQEDVDTWLAPVSEAAPGGDNLEYDPKYRELFILIKGTPERQEGERIIPAEEPNWRDIRARCTALLARTKDLAVAVGLCESLIRLSGWGGLRDGLAVLAGMVGPLWEVVHPLLDPEDGNDPTMRLNILATLTNPSRFLAKVRAIPLTESAAAGRFGLREIAWATGRAAPPEDQTPPTAAIVAAAFTDTGAERLGAIAVDLDAATESVQQIDAALGERLGLGQGIDFTPLLKVLSEAREALAPHLGGGGVTGGGGDTAAGGDHGATGEGGGGKRSAPGEISGPADVVAAIDRICAYYEKFERSSPVPLLLRRAQKLVDKGVLEILEELVPDAVSSMKSLGGIRDE